MPGIKVAAPSNGLNPDLYTGVCYYTLYSHIGLARRRSLTYADGPHSQMVISRLYERVDPFEPRNVLKRFNVNTRSNLSWALCRPREKGTHALIPYRSGTERRERERKRERERERERESHSMREAVQEEKKGEQRTE